MFLYKKSFFLFIFIAVMSMSAYAESMDTIFAQQTDSIYWAEREKFSKQFNDSVKQEQIQHQGRFELYPTEENTLTLLKLDTETGCIWQVQYSTDNLIDQSTIVLDTLSKLNDNDLRVPGRFKLYPTNNTFNFILLDRIDGRTWQVQWGMAS